MRARLVSAFVLMLLACKDNPSALDQPPGRRGSADPWRGTTPSHGKGSDFSGMDVQSVIDRIREGIDTPGPYEAPKQSPGFDADKPHWGVMRLHGAMIERE